ncbi:MAG TPA: permease-like cell division protein FtsX [Candidatus Paceibacterota bacterium]
MLGTNIKRVSRQGFISFWRNGIVSFVSVFVTTVTLFIIGTVIVGNAFLTASLADLQDKVDVNVYFTIAAPEGEILDLKTRIASLPEVKSVEYTSREQALQNFTERNKGNTLVLQSLQELGSNPLGAVLNIKAKDPSQYAGIVTYLEKQNQSTLSGDAAIIDNINYSQNQLVIERLSKMIAGLEKLGAFVSLILILMAALVTFNTIRLAIYNSRQEIGVMRLVGAGNSYIRGPFIVEGLMYGGVAALLAIILLYPATLWVGQTTSSFFGGIDLTKYYIANFLQIFVLLIVSGTVLGMLSSFVAVRRYLKV